MIGAALDEATGPRLFGMALAQLRAGVAADPAGSGEGAGSAAAGEAQALGDVARGLTLLLSAAQASHEPRRRTRAAVMPSALA